MVLSRTVCIITHSKCPILWEIRIQTEIALSTIQAEYIALLQAMRVFLPFVSLMKYIEFILELQGNTSKVLCSIFENPATVHKYIQEAIALTVALQIQHCTKHIAIKYNHFQSFYPNGNINIQHIDTKEQIADILTKPLDSELFGYICYNINGWQIKVSLFSRDSDIICTKKVSYKVFLKRVKAKTRSGKL